MGSWPPLTDDGLYDVEAECTRLHDALAASIFGNLDYYYALLSMAPSFLSEAGSNSESAPTGDQFEQILQQLSSYPELNRFLYLYDVRSLVAAVQESTKEVSQLTGEFYRILNLEPFLGRHPRWMVHSVCGISRSHAASAILICSTKPTAEVRFTSLSSENFPSFPCIRSLNRGRVIPSRAAAAS